MRGIDLKPFFSSQIAFHKVSYDYFKEYEAIEECKTMFPSNDATLKDLLHNYEGNIASKIEKESNKIAQILKMHEDDIEKKYQVQYFVVNLRKLLTIEQSTKFLQTIQDLSDEDITILDIEVIQTIIQYKWQRYTRIFFFNQLLTLLAFCVCFIADLYYWTDLGRGSVITARIVSRSLCTCVIVYFAAYEYVQMQALPSRAEYFKEIWNMNEIGLYLSYITYLILSFSLPAKGEYLYLIKCFQFVIVIFTFVKLCFLLRIFDKLGFLVQMLAGVFKDIGYFLLFFAIVIGAFTAVLGIIVSEATDVYEGIRPISFYIIALRQSIGDTDTDSLIGNSEYRVLAWLLWVIILIVGNIVFMNFVIAVVGSSYENCMEKMIAQSYKAKLNMIIEREIVMRKLIFITPRLDSWFPSFIILCRHVEGDAGNSEAQ